MLPTAHPSPSKNWCKINTRRLVVVGVDQVPKLVPKNRQASPAVAPSAAAAAAMSRRGAAATLPPLPPSVGRPPGAGERGRASAGSGGRAHASGSGGGGDTITGASAGETWHVEGLGLLQLPGAMPSVAAEEATRAATWAAVPAAARSVIHTSYFNQRHQGDAAEALTENQLWAKEMFELYDTDQSGSLDRKELVELLKSLPAPEKEVKTLSPWTVTVRGMIESMSDGGEGVVTLDEWLEQIGKCVGLTAARRAAAPHWTAPTTAARASAPAVPRSLSKLRILLRFASPSGLAGGCCGCRGGRRGLGCCGRCAVSVAGRGHMDEDVRQLDQHLEDGTLHNLITTGQTRRLLRVLDENPALIHVRDAAGNSPIHWAYTSGNLTLGRQLMERFAEDERLLHSGLDGAQYYGMNVLHIAVVKCADHPDSEAHIRWLVRRHPQLLHGRATGTFFKPGPGSSDKGGGECYYGEYPLMFAVCTNQPKVVTMMLNEIETQGLSGSGTSIEEVDSHGNTALHLTVWHDLLHM